MRFSLGVVVGDGFLEAFLEVALAAMAMGEMAATFGDNENGDGEGVSAGEVFPMIC